MSDRVLRLLAEGWSYTELPVQRIAEEAGIARSTFYVHFVDKGQLIARVADRIYDEVFQAVTEAASYEPTVGKAHRSRISTFAAGMQARLEAARDRHLQPAGTARRPEPRAVR